MAAIKEQIEVSAKDFVSVYSKMKDLSAEYITVMLGFKDKNKGYVSSLNLGNERYLSYPELKPTKALAEELVARKAMAAIVEQIEDKEKPKLLNTLSDDLYCIYENKTNTDCILKVNEKSFPAHRAILSARSTVFAAMFKHDTSENQTGEVNILDVEASTLSDVLYYVYTGRILGLNADTAVQMYIVADRYALIELRDVCLDFLMHSLTIENICDVAVLAHIHGETNLENKVVKFIAERLEELLENGKWNQLLSSKPLLANKFLCSAVLVLKKDKSEKAAL